MPVHLSAARPMVEDTAPVCRVSKGRHQELSSSRLSSDQRFEVAAMLALECAERSAPGGSNSAAQMWTTPFLSKAPVRFPCARIALELANDPALQLGRPPWDPRMASVWRRSAVVQY